MRLDRSLRPEADELWIEHHGVVPFGRRLYRPRSQGRQACRLPVQQTTKVELIINLKTAKTLGITVPNTLIGRADELIE